MVTKQIAIISKDEVLNRISSIVDQTSHKVTDTSTIDVSKTQGSDLVITDGSKEFHLNDDISKLAASRFVGINSYAFDKMTVGLQRRVIEAVLQASDPFSIITDDNRVIQLTNSKASPINVVSLLDHIEKSIEGMQFHTASVRRNRIADISIVSPIVKPIKINGKDVIQAGAFISVSPSGSSTPKVRAYTVNQICSNGAVSSAYGQEYNYTDGEQVNGWATDSIKESLASVGITAEQYIRLSKIEIDDDSQRKSIIRNMIEKSNLSEDNSKLVWDRAKQTPPNTLWDVFNIITYVVTHQMSGGTSRYNAWRGIGDFAARHSNVKHKCDICNKEHANEQA